MQKILNSGNFVIGCNYWASHAGTSMWSEWDETIIDEDLKQIAQTGIQLLRIFPLWSEFQPLKQQYSCKGIPYEIRMGEETLPETEAGQAGICEKAFERFKIFADMAEACKLKLSVGLITGWMSGRLFVPPAFERLNCITDPLVMKWQIRFVRYFVRNFRKHPAIIAWGPGNECNCLGAVENREQAWIWLNAICSAIRLEDKTRPIISGMHSLIPAGNPGIESESTWSIQDNGELTDMLTTHPYPLFTPYAGLDRLNAIRNCFHATAESRFYADIAGKPCICEELGTLGQMHAGEQDKKAYVKTVLFNLWSHDCHGLLWWCAFDQLPLAHSPYDWSAVERELGLFKSGYVPKPELEALDEFNEFLKSLPFENLPKFRGEALCVLTRGQDAWANAWSSFILCKQAGFDLEFNYTSDELKDSSLYLLPGLNGPLAISRAKWLKLIDKVKAGATLYASLDDAILSPFNEVFGVELQYREVRSEPLEFSSHGVKFRLESGIKYVLKAQGAEVLIAEADGNPVFLKYQLGQGCVYLLTAPLERFLTQTPGSFHNSEALPFYCLYADFAEPWLKQRLARTTQALVTLTEHRFNEKKAVIVLVNNSPDDVSADLILAPGWRLEHTLYGHPATNSDLRISANNATVLTIIHKG